MGEASGGSWTAGVTTTYDLLVDRLTYVDGLFLLTDAFLLLIFFDWRFQLVF